jgi:hypothetical protein
MLRESLSIIEKVQPNAWFTFDTRAMLGAALLGQKKYAEAEPLLLQGYEGLKAHEKNIPPQAAFRIAETLDHLVKLYLSLKKPDEVKKYRALRDTYPPRLLPRPREESPTD